MKNELPSISDAESKVMQTLWRKSPLSAEEIIGDTKAERDWASGTVKTLLNRLLNKGAISSTKEGRKYLYRPVLSKRAYLEGESRSFLDRLFDGRLAPFVSHFSSHHSLSKDEVEDLKRIVEELGSDDD